MKNWIKLNKDPKQVELVKLAGSRNRAESMAAMEVLASFVSPIIQTVIEKAAVSNTIYTELPYDQDTQPSIPLDLYIDKKVDYIRTWSQSIAGGLPSNEVQGLQELKFKTYALNSAVNMLKQFARINGLDNLARALQTMAREILVKEEINSFTPLLAALASATTNGLTHVIDNTTATVFQLDDFNRLWTRARKVNAATIDGGTPAGLSAKGLTDVYLGASMMEQIRSWVYQPMNTRAVPDTTESTVLGLPDNIRERIYSAAGAPEVFGVSIHELLELDPEGAYTSIFDSFYGGTFTAGTDCLVLGIDATREGAIKPVEVDSNGGKLVTLPDDQYSTRQNQIGFFSEKILGSVVVDDRMLLGVTCQL